MGETFVISDFHFFHNRIIRYCQRKPFSWDRGFLDELEMNEFIIQTHNDIVKPGDTVWNLGDFALCKFFSELESVFNQLNGRCNLIIGNHDCYSDETRKRLNRLPFKSISDHSILLDNKVLLSHRPVDKPRYPNIHGHTHDKSLPEKVYFNACVEALDYKPVPLDDIIQKFSKDGVL